MRLSHIYDKIARGAKLKQGRPCKYNGNHSHEEADPMDISSRSEAPPTDREISKRSLFCRRFVYWQRRQAFSRTERYW